MSANSHVREPSPYKINIHTSFLEDLTQIVFNDSLK